MDCRTQAALEYLMTYGWALVILVTAASVLFFVLQPQSNQFSCVSSDPAKIVFVSYYMPFDAATTNSCITISGGDCAYWGYVPPGKMLLRNATGGNILITKVVSNVQGSHGACTTSYVFLVNYLNNVLMNYSFSGVPPVLNAQFFPSPPIIVQAGGTINMDVSLGMSGQPSGCKIPSDFINQVHTFMLEYKDKSGYVKDVNVNCRGLPPKP